MTSRADPNGTEGHKKRSLTLPSPACSLLRPSSLALVGPWCSLSGAVGSLPVGASPLGGGRGARRCGVGALRARDAAVAPTGRCSRYATLAPSGRSPRCGTIASPGRCSLYAPVSSSVRCAQRCPCMVFPGALLEFSVPEFRTACVGTGLGVASARTSQRTASAHTSCLATLRVRLPVRRTSQGTASESSNFMFRSASRQLHFVLREASRVVVVAVSGRPRPLHGASIPSEGIRDPRMHLRRDRIPATRRMR